MPLTLPVWLSDHLLILDLFTNSVFGFRSWERNDYIFTIPKWGLGKCPLRGRNHWSSPLLLPCPILNSPTFHLFSIYTQDTTHNTHTHTHTHTIFRYLFQVWHRCPRLGGGVRPWELAPPGMGFLSSLACLLLPDSLQRADLATMNEPFPTREAWVPVILSILPVVPACQDSLLSHLPTA